MAGFGRGPQKPRMAKALLEDVRLIFKNFSGEAKTYNEEGDRNFGVILDRETAEAMAADGWTIKYLKPRPEDEDQEEQAWIKVKLKYKGNRPPKAYLITERNKTELDEQTVGMIDYANIKTVDLQLNPYQYTLSSGQEGVTAYVENIYVTIEENPLDRKYADLENE